MAKKVAIPLRSDESVIFEEQLSLFSATRVMQTHTQAIQIPPPHKGLKKSEKSYELSTAEVAGKDYNTQIQPKTPSVSVSGSLLEPFSIQGRSYSRKYSTGGG